MRGAGRDAGCAVLPAGVSSLQAAVGSIGVSSFCREFRSVWKRVFLKIR